MLRNGVPALILQGMHIWTCPSVHFEQTFQTTGDPVTWRVRRHRRRDYENPRN
jgi:hypothetical protein